MVFFFCMSQVGLTNLVLSLSLHFHFSSVMTEVTKQVETYEVVIKHLSGELCDNYFCLDMK